MEGSAEFSGSTEVGVNSRERQATFELVRRDEELFSERKRVSSSMLGKARGIKANSKKR